jgi:DNA-directed RNA polymerase specialized sigma24 family protein
MYDRPPPADDAHWRGRLLDPADRLAPNEAAACFLPVLQARLSACHPRAADDLITTAADDALVDFLHHPEKFDPARSSLLGYLGMIAECDLKNARRAEGRHHPDPRISVELDDLAGNDSSDEEVSRFEDFPDLVAVRDDLPPEERAFLDLMRQGEHCTEALAAVLGSGHLPPEEQRTLVKRVRDRIIKRLQRAAGEEGP